MTLFLAHNHQPVYTKCMVLTLYRRVLGGRRKPRRLRTMYMKLDLRLEYVSY